MGTRETPPKPSIGPVRYVVARAGDILDGQRLAIEVGGRKIGVFNVKGRFHALLYECPHARGPLCAGALQARVWAERPGDEIQTDTEQLFVSCPWHGWLFDLESGQSWWDPVHTRARRFPVEVTSGERLAQDLGETDRRQPSPGPYVTETFPVEVEDDYVVVTLRPRVEPSAAAGSS